MSQHITDALPKSPVHIVIDKELGSGKYKVYHARNSLDNSTYAVKIFPISPRSNSIYQHEKKIHSQLSHKNIIEFKPCSNFVNKNFNYNIILTEFAQYGCFFDVVKSGGLTQEKLIRTYFHQLVEGLDYLHSQNIAHLDIKLENLLLGSDFQLKIADFDQSQEINVSALKGRGTENYRAPEIIEGNLKNFISADIYSLGIVLYAFKAGGFPFCERKEESGIDLIHYDLFLNDKKGFWEAKVSHKKNKSFFSEEFMELINNMVAKDPERRYQINDIKKSRWYNGPIYTDESLKGEMERIWERILFKKSRRE